MNRINVSIEFLRKHLTEQFIQARWGYVLHHIVTRDWKRRKEKIELDKIGKTNLSKWYH